MKKFNPTIKSLIEMAMSNLAKLYPGYNPLKGHTIETRKKGKSFFDTNTFVEHILEYDMIDLVQVVPGHEGAVCITTSYGIQVGITSATTLVDDVYYELKLGPHGDLLPFGPVTEELSPTEEVTWVLTPESSPNGDTMFVLASVYPGKPDPETVHDLDQFRELPVGTKLTGKELWDRFGITRAIEE